jgi:hypothetical protein
MGDCCCVHGAAETEPGGGVDVGPWQRARDEGLDEGQPPDLATKNHLAAGPSAYRKRVSGLLTIRIKGALGGNYSLDTLPWIDCFAFNAEIVCLVLQNKGIAAGA